MLQVVLMGVHSIQGRTLEAKKAEKVEVVESYGKIFVIYSHF